MANETFENIWDAIEPNPAAAAQMKLRSALMTMLRERIRAQGWTQIEAAERLGVTQPRISDLMRGKIGLFSLDTLVLLLAAAGVQLEIHAKDAA